MAEQNERQLLFKKMKSAMISTNDNAYSNKYATRRRETNRDYTVEEIQNILRNGSLDEQVALSNSYFNKDGIYRRTVIHYATIFKYCGMTIPVLGYGKSIEDENLYKRYFNAVAFSENIGIPELCTQFALKGLINGTYFGVVCKLDKGGLAIMDLPPAYCLNRYKDNQGNDLIEFDLNYFKTIRDETMRGRALDAFPPEIVKAWRKYDKNSSQENRYFLIPSDIGICFSFYNGFPLFLNVIASSIDFQDTKEAEKNRAEEEIKKIIIQKIPHLNDGTLLFEPPEAEELHSAAVGMMKKNKNTSVLTTYCDVDAIGSEAVAQSATNNTLNNMTNAIYTEAGVSGGLFNATGNLAMSNSLKNDMALMMPIILKFQRFFSNVLNKIFGNSSISFSYQFLPVTWYNESDFISNAFKMASSGYSFLIPAIAAGTSQRDLLTLKDLENKVLNLRDALIPLSTSYTESPGEQGRPSIADDKKQDSTIKKEISIDGGE